MLHSSHNSSTLENFNIVGDCVESIGANVSGIG